MNTKSHTRLFFFTDEFPFGSGEAFIENEINILSQEFGEIVVFPDNITKQHVRPLSGNVRLVKADEENIPAISVLRSIGKITQILFTEFIHARNKIFFLRNIRKWASRIKKNIRRSKVVAKEIAARQETVDYFYSYWMNDWALTCSLLKDEGKINNFVFRVLGYDIYDERHPGDYNPFQYYNFSRTDKVFGVSMKAAAYLRAKNRFPEKIGYSYLGTKDLGPAVFEAAGVFTLYSCSNLIPLKRVEHIAVVLKNITFKLKWIHRGDGPLKEELLKVISSLPANIEVELLGRVNEYSEVLDHMRRTSANLFINLSETEGLPVTIIEAISFGIPVLATDVGGTSEVVNEKTGILVPKEFDHDELVKLISDFRTSSMNTVEFRTGVRNFWKEHFSAENNYRKFCKEIKNS